MSDPITNDILLEFLAESRENMDQMERDLVAWEKKPSERALLDRIFRAVHTLKGTCGFLNFGQLESAAHEAETLLAQLREGKIAPSPQVVTVLLQVLDLIRRQLGHIEKTGEEDPKILGSVLSDLKALKEHGETWIDSPAEAAPADEPVVGGGGAADASIRVNVRLLDRLMDTVGELVLVRNQLVQMAAVEERALPGATGQRLNLITSELQQAVMKTRLQPIGTVWERFPRMCRDAAAAGGKKVRMEMSGQQTELDRSIIESIRDPLTHLIRNCLDHGIETVEKRMAAGKKEDGLIRLRAFHEGGQVQIEISDDGDGIRPDVIRDAALRQGIITPAKALTMNDRETVGLIFSPGFSTAQQVTRLSGRGVGLDVVRSNLESISGSVDVISRPGEGTTFTIKIPLTLAIVPALLIACAGQRFAIPQVNLLEVLRLTPGQVENVGAVCVYRLRGKLVPVVRLREVLRLDDGATVAEENLIILEANGRLYGLVVDSLHDTQEIVVKPLDRSLKALGPYAGATILGDGSISLILDPTGVAALSKLDLSGPMEEAPAAPAAPADTGEDLLLFDLSGDYRCAVPLSEVTRLEEFDLARVESSELGDVVQYGERIMPLIPLYRLLNPRAAAKAANPEGRLRALVHDRPEGCYGFLVERVVDIAREPLSLQHEGEREGVRGSAILRGRVTHLLDLDILLRLRYNRTRDGNLATTSTP
jgi:two-component system chemotaxis sensor kinase CheA